MKVRVLVICFIVVVMGGFMSQTAKQSPEKSEQATSQGFVKGLWGVRYQVKDVSRSVNFYTKQLGLKLDNQNLPAFAQVSVGNLKLILSGPGASGSRVLPDGSTARTWRLESNSSSG